MLKPEDIQSYVTFQDVVALKGRQKNQDIGQMTHDKKTNKKKGHLCDAGLFFEFRIKVLVVGLNDARGEGR